MKIQNMTSSNGNKVANQFVINDGHGCLFFQSYKSIIVKLVFNDGATPRKVYMDKATWDYSRTTSRYRNQFLGESTKETQAKIDSGEYILTDLN